jgi:hypothetical protein
MSDNSSGDASVNLNCCSLFSLTVLILAKKNFTCFMTEALSDVLVNGATIFRRLRLTKQSILHTKHKLQADGNYKRVI